MTSACARHEEDLALLAGGDLPARAEAELRQHLDACTPCRGLLAGLEADQGVMVHLAAMQPDEAGSLDAPLTAAVLARLATEAHEEAVRRLAAGPAPGFGSSRQRRRIGLGAFGRAAAVVAVVVSASLLGLSALDLGGAAGPETILGGAEGSDEVALGRAADPSEIPAVPAVPEVVHDVVDVVQMASRALPARDSGIPLGLRVRRASAGVELTWVGDGRESGRSGSVGTYRVRASGDPRDLSQVPAVEVAGRQLVADLPVAVSRAADRKLTFFSLE